MMGDSKKLVGEWIKILEQNPFPDSNFNPHEIPKQTLAKFKHRLKSVSENIESALSNIDPISQPSSIFDASNPITAGYITAIAFIAQPSKPISQIEKFYGAGIYAIYYMGKYKPYTSISKTETPVYIGKANPYKKNAISPSDQGTKLYDRISDHRRSIEKVKNLDINDFYCRYLCVLSGS